MSRPKHKRCRFPVQASVQASVGAALLLVAASANAQTRPQDEGLALLRSAANNLDVARRDLRELRVEALIENANEAAYQALVDTSDALNQSLSNPQPAGATQQSSSAEPAAGSSARPAAATGQSAPPAAATGQSAPRAAATGQTASEQTQGSQQQPSANQPAQTASGSATPSASRSSASSSPASPSPASTSTSTSMASTSAGQQAAGENAASGQSSVSDTAGGAPSGAASTSGPSSASPASGGQQGASAPNASDSNANVSSAGQQQAVASPSPAPIPKPSVSPAIADGFVGQTVYGADGQELGTLRRLVVGPGGQIQSAVIEHGGFIGLFTSRNLVPWSAGNPTIEGNRLILHLTPQQVAQAPTPPNQ